MARDRQRSRRRQEEGRAFSRHRFRTCAEKQCESVNARRGSGLSYCKPGFLCRVKSSCSIFIRSAVAHRHLPDHNPPQLPLFAIECMLESYRDYLFYSTKTTIGAIINLSTLCHGTDGVVSSRAPPIECKRLLLRITHAQAPPKAQDREAAHGDRRSSGLL